MDCFPKCLSLFCNKYNVLHSPKSKENIIYLKKKIKIPKNRIWCFCPYLGTVSYTTEEAKWLKDTV